MASLAKTPCGIKGTSSPVVFGSNVSLLWVKVVGRGRAPAALLGASLDHDTVTSLLPQNLKINNCDNFNSVLAWKIERAFPAFNGFPFRGWTPSWYHL